MSTRVLVLEDSLLIRNLLWRGLEGEPEVTVRVSSPRMSGLESFLRTAAPDVVVMDLGAVAGGPELARALGATGVPVIALAPPGSRISEVLRQGATAVIERPNEETAGTFVRRLAEEVRAALRKRSARPQGEGGRPVDMAPTSRYELVAIGASTGGTQAIEAVLSCFVPNLPPVVIVQHMPAAYTWRFAERLNQVVPLEVREAEDGEPLVRGTVLIAPGDQHLRVRRQGGQLVAQVGGSDRVSGHCPSVDVLFESVAQTLRQRALGVLLTGMGADGARGLLAMKQAGAVTAAQDQATSIVWGMPRVAIELGAANVVLGLSEVAPWVNQRAMHG